MPWTRDRMQPADVFDLVAGEQERLNQNALLAAWVAWFVAMSIPSLAKGSTWRDECKRFDMFLEKFPPPGYRPEKRPDTKVRRRR